MRDQEQEHSESSEAEPEQSGEAEAVDSSEQESSEPEQSEAPGMAAARWLLADSETLAALLAERVSKSSRAAGCDSEPLAERSLALLLAHLSDSLSHSLSGEQAERLAAGWLAEAVRREARSLRQEQEQAGWLTLAEAGSLLRLTEQQAERLAVSSSVDTAAAVAAAVDRLSQEAGRAALLTQRQSGCSLAEAVSRTAALLLAPERGGCLPEQRAAVIARRSVAAARQQERAQRAVSLLAALTGTQAEAARAGEQAEPGAEQQSAAQREAAAQSKEQRRAERLCAAASLTQEQAEAVLAAHSDYSWQPPRMSEAGAGASLALSALRLTERSAEQMMFAAADSLALTLAVRASGSFIPPRTQRSEQRREAWTAASEAAAERRLSVAGWLLAPAALRLPLSARSEALAVAPYKESERAGAYFAEALLPRRSGGKLAGSLVAARSVSLAPLTAAASLSKEHSESLRMSLACERCRWQSKQSTASSHKQQRAAALAVSGSLLWLAGWQAEALTAGRAAAVAVADSQRLAAAEADWLTEQPPRCSRCLAGWLRQRADRLAADLLAPGSAVWLRSLRWLSQSSKQSGSVAGCWLSWQESSRSLPVHVAEAGSLAAAQRAAALAWRERREADRAADARQRLSSGSLALLAQAALSGEPLRWLAGCAAVADSEADRAALLSEAASKQQAAAALLLAAPLSERQEPDSSHSKEARRWQSVTHRSESHRLAAAGSAAADWLADSEAADRLAAEAVSVTGSLLAVAGWQSRSLSLPLARWLAARSLRSWQQREPLSEAAESRFACVTAALQTERQERSSSSLQADWLSLSREPLLAVKVTGCRSLAPADWLAEQEPEPVSDADRADRQERQERAAVLRSEAASLLALAGSVSDSSEALAALSLLWQSGEAERLAGWLRSAVAQRLALALAPGWQLLAGCWLPVSEPLRSEARASLAEAVAEREALAAEAERLAAEAAAAPLPLLPVSASEAAAAAAAEAARLSEARANLAVARALAAAQRREAVAAG